MDGNKLLIVEDNEPVAQLLAVSLSDCFTEIHFAPTLAAARRRFRLVDGTPFDFVICSFLLPDGAATEFQQWLDKYQAPRRVPFVVLAGSLPGIRRPPSDTVLLSKPFQLTELREALTRARSQAGQGPPADRIREGISFYAPGIQGL